LAGHAVHFDHTFAPFGHAVLDRLGLCPGDRVIDIGCGVGAPTLSIASTWSSGITMFRTGRWKLPRSTSRSHVSG